MKRLVTRRRALAVLAAAAGLPLFLRAGTAQARLVRWEGVALGAQASLSLYHDDEAAAGAAIEAAVAELRRLEAIFSLYRADSALSALNRDGRLAAAPAELVAVLSAAAEVSALTEGAYDATMQPLWQVYFQHFTAQAAPDPSGPSAAAVAAARALVDWRAAEIDGAELRLARPGMAVSLNGIAQGYVSDRIAAVLRGHGLDRMLVDMGEPSAIGVKPDGSAWRVGIADPRAPERLITTVDAVDQAVATSGGYGTVFDQAGRFTHLIDPRTGATAPADASVTVIADSAMRADALSTALAVTAADRRRAVVAAAGVSALFVGPDGAISKLAG